MSLSRRNFLFSGVALATSSAVGSSAAATPAVPTAPAVPAPSPTMLPLPWELNALDPVISATTVGIHYGKHHKGYADNLNKLIAGTNLADLSLEALMLSSASKATPQDLAIFNNSAQVWNHNFYWRCVGPNSGGKPPAEIAKRLEASFGSLEAFKTAFVGAALQQFGSGWAWLVHDRAANKLTIVKTGNADTPATNPNYVTLAVIDVWEHAYYLDYQNRRADYANALYDRLLNWRFVEENLSRV